MSNPTEPSELRGDVISRIAAIEAVKKCRPREPFQYAHEYTERDMIDLQIIPSLSTLPSVPEPPTCPNPKIHVACNLDGEGYCSTHTSWRCFPNRGEIAGVVSSAPTGLTRETLLTLKEQLYERANSFYDDEQIDAFIDLILESSSAPTPEGES